jgi:SHAQKYF class myb-like DNA-binding protein
MLAPSLLPHFASQTDQLLKHQMNLPSTCADKMRNSPGPSCSNNDSHDVTGIAPSALGDGAKSVQQGAEIARSGTRPAYEDCQCSADSLNPSTNHIISSIGGTNTRALQAPYQRMPYFPEALPIFAKASEPSKPATASTGVAKSCAANSSSEGKRSHGMDYKKSRMVWSEDLHNQFLRALTDIGLRHAVPKTIMQVNSARSLSFLFYCSVSQVMPQPMYMFSHVTLN